MPEPRSFETPANDDEDQKRDDQLLDTGQEEVFSRTEVERGVTEHSTEAGKPVPPLSAPD